MTLEVMIYLRHRPFNLLIIILELTLLRIKTFKQLLLQLSTYYELERERLELVACSLVKLVLELDPSK